MGVLEEFKGQYTPPKSKTVLHAAPTGRQAFVVDRGSADADVQMATGMSPHALTSADAVINSNFTKVQQRIQKAQQQAQEDQGPQARSEKANIQQQTVTDAVNMVAMAGLAGARSIPLPGRPAASISVPRSIPVQRQPDARTGIMLRKSKIPGGAVAVPMDQYIEEEAVKGMAQAAGVLETIAASKPSRNKSIGSAMTNESLQQKYLGMLEPQRKSALKMTNNILFLKAALQVEKKKDMRRLIESRLEMVEANLGKRLAGVGAAV
jgi:hypothetical protein